jgi:hypothetical protein
MHCTLEEDELEGESTLHTVIRFKLQSLSALNEANLTSATQTLNFNPIMHYQAKTSQPDGKILF